MFELYFTIRLQKWAYLVLRANALCLKQIVLVEVHDQVRYLINSGPKKCRPDLQHVLLDRRNRFPSWGILATRNLFTCVKTTITVI